MRNFLDEAVDSMAGGNRQWAETCALLSIAQSLDALVKSKGQATVDTTPGYPKGIRVYADSPPDELRRRDG